MSYKTILVHVDQSRHAGARIERAAAIAIAENAHLIGVALTGISRFAYKPGGTDLQDPNLSAYLDCLHARGRHALAQFEQAARQMGVLSVETRLVDDDAAAGVSLQARYADLIVLGQSDPQEPSPSVLPDFPEDVMLHCGRPVLLVPYAGQPQPGPARVLLAWDASMEAMRAVGGAMPLLRRAARVDVAVFNPQALGDAHGAMPGADIALYLARHGVQVDVTQQDTDIDIGNALLSLAAERGSELIVMGGYAHSRLREIMLGGATRTVLASMTVPVLMAH